MSSKKYKLFKPADDGRPPPCAFFASSAGCKNGGACKFHHERTSSSTTPTILANLKRDRSPSVVSSESEGGLTKMSASKLNPLKLSFNEIDHGEGGNSLEKKKKEESVCLFYSSSEGCKSGKKCRFLHANPESLKQSTPSTTMFVSGKVDESIVNDPPVKSNKRKNRRSANADIFAAPQREDPSMVRQPTKKARKSIKESSIDSKQILESADFSPENQSEKSVVTSKPSFRELNLPIASFSIPGFQLKGTARSAEENVLPLPKSTPQGRKWLEAVIKTRENRRYASSYDFKKLKEQDAANGSAMPSDWVKAKPFGDWCKSNPQTIAIDCEMCETQDPVTGCKNFRALCRISIVNGDCPDEVLLDTLVKPDWPVTDYRTWVNGIETKHLENVEFTLLHAQQFLMALCSEETVIIGHAVYNDLAAVRMEHRCVVDSSFLFAVKDLPDANPGLKDITKAILSLEMPNTHDSVNDALMSFRCLEVWLEKSGDVEPVEKVKEVKNKLATSQLFVHRIPKFCQKDHLETMFMNQTCVQPTDIGDIEFNGENGKTVITFMSFKHANLAFGCLQGEEVPDTSGRLQKKVFLRTGGYIRVRKMVHEKVNKKSAEAGNSAQSSSLR